MLQEASTHLFFPETSEDLIANEPWSIDIYADGLMDEIFADIDQILDARGNFASQTVNAEYVPLQTVKMPQIVLNQSVPGVPDPKNKSMVDNAQMKPTSKKRQRTRHVWGRLLILGSTLGVAIAGVIYLVQFEVINRLTYRITHTTLQVPQSQLPTRVDVQAELVDYMLGALAVIEKQQISQRPVNSRIAIGANPNQTIGNLSSPLIANNLPAIPNRSTNVVERIYIPVESASSPGRYTPPLQPLSPDAVNNALNTLPKPAKPANVNIYAAAVRPDLKPVPVKTTPVPVGRSTNLLPALPVVPFRAAPPKLPTAQAPTPSTTIQQHAYLSTSPVATPSHTLEGLLELGDKSAALFKIEGVSQRINVGENIGSSGWTLVDVNNGEAIVRRNGEVRSIFTGQKL
ncbi:MAG: hypothetical protein KME23_29405 [Goleter apudmare HA4340-LM2]|jgi:hypothetical protein|nr:hypothetical protein [Goleter apudmare HA4340-LM2]